MITEFELHAFIDGEMAEEECVNIQQAAASSVALRERLDQLQQLKSLVRAGYQDEEYPADIGNKLVWNL
jgi:hypothetical protein